MSTPGASVWAGGLFVDPKHSEDPRGLRSSLRAAFLPDRGDKPHGAPWKRSATYPHWCLCSLATCSAHGGLAFGPAAGNWLSGGSPTPLGASLLEKVTLGLSQDCFTSPGPEQQCDSSVIRLECHFFVSLLRGIIPPAIGLRNSHSEPVLNKALRTAFVASQNKSEMQRVPNCQATPSPRGPGSPRNCGGVRPPWESKIADYSPRGKHMYPKILCRVPQTFICVNSILTSDPEPAPSPGPPP